MSDEINSDNVMDMLEAAGFDVVELKGLTNDERKEVIEKALSDSNLPDGFEVEEEIEEQDLSDPRYVEKVKATSHQLEDFFDIEEGTTMVPYKERVPTELVPCTSYDQKDTEIETQLQEIYDAAMEAYENSIEEAEDIEPKYQARAREVSAEFLKTALAAIKEKGTFKTNKDKIERASKNAEGDGKSGVTNNFFIDRNELLKKMREEKQAAEKEILDGDYQEVEDKEG